MSTTNQPINIAPQNVVGKCDLKCSYIYKYPESNLNAKNNGQLISLTYDNGSSPPVIFNQQKYNVTNINLYCPSVHLFNGAQASAEIMIQHVPETTGQLLTVCVPIVQSGNSSTASDLLTEVITGVSQGAPSEGETTTLSVSDFTLQNIVPKKPYFFYNGYDNQEYIVYGLNIAIPLSENTITTLSQIIKPFSATLEGGELFYNSKGPGSSDIKGNDIYISCKPTGSSGETTDTTQNKPTTPINWKAIFSSSAFQTTMQIILIIIIFLVIFYGINAAFNYIISGPTKLKFPSISSSNG